MFFRNIFPTIDGDNLYEGVTTYNNRSKFIEKRIFRRHN